MKHKPNRLLAIFCVLLVAVVLVAFQNCGELTPSNSAVLNQASLEYRIKADSIALARDLGLSTFLVRSSAKASTIAPTSGAVTSVSSLVSGGFNLAPPSGQTGPSVMTSTTLGLPVFNFASGNQLGTTQPNQFLSTTHSVIALFEGPLSGHLLSFVGTSPKADELSISADASGTINVYHYTDGANYTLLSQKLTSNSGPIVIGVAWGEAANAITMQINGVVVTTPVQTFGTPTNNNLISRQLVVGDTGSTFKLGEILAYSEALAPADINTLSRYAGEDYGDMSVYFDATLYPEAGGPTPSPDAIPANVQTILAKCYSCHQHADWSGYTTNQQFKSANLVIAKNYLNSPLYYMLQGSEGTLGSKDMPQGGTISADEVSQIKTWILNMN